MTEERFLNAKTALITKMEISGNHCEESIEAVKKATCVKELSALFDFFLNEAVRKDFPQIDYFREYFKEESKELQGYGIYFDYIGDINADRRTLHILGDSVVTLNIEDMSVHKINVSHNSHVFICACEYSIVRVRKSEMAKVDIIEKSKYSKVLVR